MRQLITNKLLAKATGYTVETVRQIRKSRRSDRRGVLAAERELEAALLNKAAEIRARISQVSGERAKQLADMAEQLEEISNIKDLD